MESEPVISETNRVRHAFLPGRADLESLLSLALPVVVVQVGLMAMGVVDTLMVGHVSAADLAATALGNLYVFGLLAFGMGSLMALDPIVSQAVGAGDGPAVARAIQRGLLLAAVLTGPLSLLFLPAEWLFRTLRQQPEVIPIATGYCKVSIPGVLPFLCFVVLRQTLQAMRRLRPIVTTILLANVLNAALCWVLVFGHLGAARMGAVGAGIATTLSRWAMMFGLLAIAWKELEPHLVPWRRDVVEPAALARMLALGAPIGVQFQLEFGVFAVVALFMGELGTVPMAAHQIAINIASFTFMVPLGVSAAAAVMVGRAIGAGDPAGARRAAAAALGAGGAFMLLSGLALGLAPAALARAYSSEAAVIALAALLIPIAAVFQVFDGLQVVSIGVLRGAGDTRTPMIVNIVGFWAFGLPISLWLCFAKGKGPVGLWWGFVAGLAAVAIFLLVRVRSRLMGELSRVVIDEQAPAR
jgi:MATE family, multidrug efflux pump